MSAWLLSLTLAAAPLTLDEVVESARASLPTLSATRTDVEAAQGEQLAADGAFDPMWKTRASTVPLSGYPQTRVDTVVEVPTPLWGATLFGGYRLGVGKIQSYYGGRETWTGGELRAGASVPVLRNGPIDRRRANQARAELGRALAGLGVEQQQLEVRRLAATRFYEWVAAGERREVARALLQLAVDRDRQLQQRAGAGDVAQFDRQDNARALVQREAFVVQAQRGLDQAAFELSLYLRDERGDPVVPDEERLPRLPDLGAGLAQVSPDEVVARRPDVRRLGDQKKQAEVELRYQQNQLWPSLEVGVAVSKDLGVAPRPELAALGPAELEVTAALDVPLLYRAPTGRIQTARAAVAKLDAQLRFARDRVAMELRDAHSAFTAASARLEFARREIAVALELEKGERTRFELGESNLLFVNLREQATGEARLREVDARLDGLKAAAAFLAVSAQPDEK